MIWSTAGRKAYSPDRLHIFLIGILRVIFVHLFNDRSGSPRVLASVIDVIGDPQRDLLCVAKGDGILESMPLEKCYYRYNRRNNRVLTFFEYLLSQLDLFFLLRKEARHRPTDEMIYVNTAYPFAAALFGWFSGRKVIYHLHEVSITPAVMRRFLWGVVKLTATEVRFVSEHQKRISDFKSKKTRVIYNAMSRDLAKADIGAPMDRVDDLFRVLMPSTMRDYKGIPEFLELAQLLADRSNFLFQLVTNDEPEVVEVYLNSLPALPSNVQLIPRTSDLAPLYRQASVVVNLSRPEEWIETFGLTILEAMSFGIPVIAPPAGGPIELLSGGLDDFLIRGDDAVHLGSVLRNLQVDRELYKRVSELCRQRAAVFDWQLFVDSLNTEE